MARIEAPRVEDAPADAQPLLAAVQQQLGVVPNLFRTLAISPAALEALLGLQGTLGKSLDVKTRNRIAIAVAEANGCDYCLSAHTELGLKAAKLDLAEVRLNRTGHSAEPKADAAVAFARQVALSRGKVSDAELAAVRAAGWTDAQVLEIVAHVVANVFTNFVNNVADTDIDFPVVRTLPLAA